MDNKSELLMYQSKDGRTELEVKLKNENVWLPLLKIAE